MSTAVVAPQAQAQTSEGTVRLLPALSSVALEDGSFEVFVVVEDFQHTGLISHDVNRDTVPDGQETSVGLAAFEFTLQYAPAILAVAGVDQGPELERTGRHLQCLGPVQEPNNVRFGCVSSGSTPDGTQGTFTLAAVKFTPLAPGLSPLLLEAEVAGPLGDSANVDVNGGAVRVTGRPVASTRVPSATATAGAPATLASATRPLSGTQPPAGTPGATVTGSGRATGTPAKPSAGNGEPTDLAVPGNGGQGANGSADAGDEGSFGGAALWSIVAVGAVGGAAALGLATFLWRRRRHQGGA